MLLRLFLPSFAQNKSTGRSTHHSVENDELGSQLEDDVVEAEGAHEEDARVEAVGDPAVGEGDGEHAQAEGQQGQDEGEEVELVPDGADPVCHLALQRLRGVGRDLKPDSGWHGRQIIGRSSVQCMVVVE